MDDLRRRVPVAGPMHLVLHRGEEPLGGFGGGIVVNAGGVDFEHPAPEFYFRGPDVADAGQELIEVVACAALLELFVVEDEALDEVITQLLSRPNAELDAAMGFHAVANRDDDIEGVILDLVVLAAGGSCCRKCNNSFRLQFSFIENVLDMAGDGGFIALKEFGDLPGGKPNGFTDKSDVNAGLPVLRSEREGFRRDHSSGQPFPITPNHFGEATEMLADHFEDLLGMVCLPSMPTILRIRAIWGG